MTVTNRQATTVFDRFNASITDIFDFSDPIATNYTAEDFFTLYDIVFNVNTSNFYWPVTTQYLFLVGIQTYLDTPTSTQNGTGADDRLTRLQDFLVTPIFLFNNGVYGGPTPSEAGKSVSLATPSYRVVPIFLIS